MERTDIAISLQKSRLLLGREEMCILLDAPEADDYGCNIQGNDKTESGLKTENSLNIES